MKKESSEPYISDLGSYIPALDGIRGWAILMVILNHSVMLFPYKSNSSFIAGKIFKYFSMGWMGVDLFFVLSGFLITGILLRTRDENKFLFNFYARRTLRIFPLYYFTISLFLYGGPLIVENFNHIYIATVPYSKFFYYFYIQNFLAYKFDVTSIPQLLMNPTWSLAVEEHFYLLWPALVYFCRKRLILVSLVGIIISIFIRLLFLYYGSPLDTLVYTCTFTRMDSILIGSAIALALNNIDSRHVLEKYKWHAFLLILFALVMFNVLNKLTHTNLVNIVGYTIFALFFGSIINLLLFLPKRGLFVRFFDNALFRCFGKYSYSMYLFHTPVILFVRAGVLEHLQGGPLLIFFVMLIASIVLTLVVSLFTWNFYEKHFIYLKKYFEKKDPEKQTGSKNICVPLGELE